MTTPVIEPARDEAARAAVRGMVWEFFDLLRTRYPEMAAPPGAPDIHMHLDLSDRAVT